MNEYVLELKRIFTRFTDYKGRSDRYSYIVFFVFLLMFNFLGSKLPSNVLILINILIFIPKITLTIRRLHDTNNSGWLVFIKYILVLIIFLAPKYISKSYFSSHLIISFLFIIYNLNLLYLTLIKKGDEGFNRYGEPFDRKAFNEKN